MSIALAALALVACGAVRPAAVASPGASPPASSGSGGPADMAGPSVPLPPMSLVFVVKQGADPIAIGHRIAGPDAAVRSMPAGPPDDLPKSEATRTYVVVLPAGQEQEALARARSDPGVERVTLKPTGLPPAGGSG